MTQQVYDPSLDNVVVIFSAPTPEAEVTAKEAQAYFDAIDEAIALEEGYQFQLKERKPLIDYANATLTLEPSDAPYLGLKDTIVLDFTPSHSDGYVFPAFLIEENGVWVDDDCWVTTGDSFVLRVSPDTSLVVVCGTRTSGGSAWLIQGFMPRCINVYPVYDASLDKEVDNAD